MKKEINHSRLDEVLKLLIIRETKPSSKPDSLNVESELIFSSNPQVAMSITAKSRLIEKLNESLQDQSLGEIIKSHAECHHITLEEICNVSGLAESVVNTIGNDRIFPNCIPINSIKRIFENLQIGLEQGEIAIRKTFKSLMNEIENKRNQHSGVLPSFRKNHPDDPFNLESDQIGSGANNLYRNEIALNKYLDRLKELLQN